MKVIRSRWILVLALAAALMLGGCGGGTGGGADPGTGGPDTMETTTTP
jgi:hypothetical protein